MDCIGMNLKNAGLPFFKFRCVNYLYMCQNVIYTTGKSFSVVVAMILQMKDTWSASLTFRVHN